MTDFAGLLATLSGNGVEFIVIGGAAAIAHGSVALTQDLDILYRRSNANLQNLGSALSGYQPYLRGVPAGLPFQWSLQTLKQGLNFTLVTTIGSIDLLGEIPGGGTYEDMAAGAIELRLFETKCLCLSLPQLILTKRAAGRPKDLQVLAELEAIEDEHG